MAAQDETAPGTTASTTHRPFRVRLLVASLSGVILAQAFPPAGWYPIAWVGLVPLMWAMSDLPPLRARAVGFAAGLGFYGFAMHWVFHLFGAPSIALIAIEAAFFWVFAAVFAWMPRSWSPTVRAIVLAGAWAGIDYFRSECWWLRYGWFGLGYSQTAYLPLLQLASVFGGYGITFLIVFTNSALYETVTRRAEGAYVSLVTAVAVLLLCHLTGTQRLAWQPETTVGIALVQDESFDRDSYLAATASAALQKPDIIIWPELAIMDVVAKGDAASEQLARAAADARADLVVGCKTPADAPGKSAEEAFHNSALFFTREGAYLGEYTKHHTVQFVNDGIPGTETPTFPCHSGRVGIMICYDADYPDVARDLVRNGAGLLLVPTLDAMGWGRAQHLQHAAMTPMRAAETGRFIARAASSGISQIVDPCGRELLRTGTEPTIAVGMAGMTFHITPYVAWGYLFAPVCLYATLALCVCLAVLRIRRRRELGPSSGF